MEIRLANYQGLLSTPSLNKWQQFAANYWVRMDRRVALDDIEETLQRQTWYTEPLRYQELFLAGAIRTDEPPPQQSTDEVVDDISEIDRYFENLDEKKTMNGAQLFDLLDNDGWV